MSCLRALALGCFAAALGAADATPLRLARCDELVRPPALFRAVIQREVAADEFALGPFTLQVSIEQGGRLLAADDVSLANLGQLREGVAVVLAPGEPDAARADADATLSVTLTNPARTRIERLSRDLVTPRGLAHELSALTGGLRARGETDPLPWLWAEQGAEIADGGESASQCHLLAGLVGQLREWSLGRHPPPGPLVAYRDALDGSVQPERRHAPTGERRCEAWLFASPPRAPRKSAWPAPPAEWLSAASAAGCEVIESYPAGDLRWEGAALLRAEERLAHASGRVLLVGSGDGALACARLAALHPQRVALVRLVGARFQGQTLPPAPAGVAVTVDEVDAAAREWAGGGERVAGPADPAFWSAPDAQPSSAAPATRAQALPTLATRLASYAAAPFVVVVGLGEHQAAQEDDRALARAFADAWAMHAHGLPRLVEDRDFRERDWRGFNLVLIGNTRSNRVLADIARDAAIPLTWDSRAVSWTVDGHRETRQRAERRPVAFSLPRPGEPERVVVVLDGAPAWRAGGLPLAGLADPFVGEPAAGERGLAPSAGTP